MRAGLIQATAPSAAARLPLFGDRCELRRSPAAPNALQIVEIAVHALHGLSDGLDGGVDGGARGLNLLAVDLILWHVPVLSMMIGVFLHAIAVGATGRYSGCYVISERVQRKNGAVVGEHMHLGSVGVSRNGGRTAKGWNIAICMLLAGVLGLCLMLWITPPVHADDSAGLGITATDDITDTQNLLGSNVSEITDAINQTKKETGVTVRLVYLDSFNAKGKPDKWVSALLESLNPKPNTVMLAVASNDGNLVVAVSSNSEEWLKKKSTVDALSDAAQKPLMESDPDWAKSATDMMNQISVQKKTSTSSRTIWIGVGGFAGALLLLVVILVVFHILRKKGVIGHRRKGRHSGRHGAVAERIQPVKEWGAESENEDYVNPDTASTQDSKSVQETSSEASDA